MIPVIATKCKCFLGLWSSQNVIRARADQLLETKVLRLDWQNIQRIENLDAFTSIRELYLQHVGDMQ